MQYSKTEPNFSKRILFLLWRILSVSAILAVLGYLTYSGMSQNYTFNWERALTYIPRFLDGLFITLLVAIAGGIIAVILGLIVALGRLSSWSALRDFAGVYVHSLRNLPFVVVMLLFYFGLGEAVEIPDVQLGPVAISATFIWGAVILGVYESSYMAEIIRSGIQSVHRTQSEAASSLGMSGFQSMRHVILPQALRVIIPPSTGIYIGMVKESALLSIIGLVELTRVGRNLYDFIDRPYIFEFYLMLAGFYLLIVVPLSFLSQWLEQRTGKAYATGGGNA